ncbi:hypothetical protein BDV96DRAFT_241437 [Lophiotrema nucula]|uniref:F-box domain-containing protein n=1 Tax=Lophiotrema nucula TaxID=690887 RepID=A0A6A5YSU3_9PLEO|nr:hypothetical protein BDV96DRAFT_241437 [Lophiotrema nucula]
MINPHLKRLFRWVFSVRLRNHGFTPQNSPTQEVEAYQDLPTSLEKPLENVSIYTHFEESLCDRSRRVAAPMLASLPYELLEAILLHLPAQDMLMAQRVCRSFNAIIRSSKLFDEPFFLNLRTTPVSSSSGSHCNSTHSSKPYYQSYSVSASLVSIAAPMVLSRC